jgi:hypothetical protein
LEVVCGLEDAISKLEWREFGLETRGVFLTFWDDFGRFLVFRAFFGVHFSVFVFFCIFDDGILAPRMPPCVIAHPKQSLKQDVCPHLDPEKPL